MICKYCDSEFGEEPCDCYGAEKERSEALHAELLEALEDILDNARSTLPSDALGPWTPERVGMRLSEIAYIANKAIKKARGE